MTLRMFEIGKWVVTMSGGGRQTVQEVLTPALFRVLSPGPVRRET